MAHKKKDNQKKESMHYTIEDVIKITDEMFKLSKDKNYNPGAFVHGLVFALEYTQIAMNIPNQQIANIKRDCRRYLKEGAFQKGINNLNKK